MKVLKLSESLNHKIETVWEVISDVSRTDWVPGVDEISLQDDTRHFLWKEWVKLKKKYYFVIMKTRFLNTVQLSHQLN